MRQKLETLVDYSLLGLQLVAQARDGSEGERLILTHQPDVVITDVVMPGKNGLEMIASLQGKTQAKLAEEIDTTKTYVNRVIKKNESVVNNTFVKMMEALGYDIELHYVKRKE